MRIDVETLTKTKITLEVELDDTIDNIKHMIRQSEGLEQQYLPDEQRLTIVNKVGKTIELLDDRRTVNMLKIEKGITIKMVKRDALCPPSRTWKQVYITLHSSGGNKDRTFTLKAAIDPYSDLLDTVKKRIEIQEG